MAMHLLWEGSMQDEYSALVITVLFTLSVFMVSVFMENRTVSRTKRMIMMQCSRQRP